MVLNITAMARSRQHGVEPIQSLNRGLFVDAEHGRMLRWMQVQTDDIGRFGFEIRIVANPIRFPPMRFQLGLGQNPRDGGLAESQRVGQFPAGPVGAAVLGLLLHSPDHSCLHRRRSRTRLAALVAAFQARQPSLFEPHLPAGDGGSAGLQTFRDLALTDAIGQSKDESCAKHISGRQRSGLRPAL
jgi:hypothetical protein